MDQLLHVTVKYNTPNYIHSISDDEYKIGKVEQTD